MTRLHEALTSSVHSKRRISYQLTDAEATELYYLEPRLAALIELGIIRWIDHHLVVNLKKFITPKGCKLTSYAKTHESACCVGIEYQTDPQSHQKQQKPAAVLDIFIHSEGFTEGTGPDKRKQPSEEQTDEAAKINSEIERIDGILNTLPGSFSGSLKQHMVRKGYTEELLAEESWVSLSTIKQYRQKEEKEKTLKTVTALCIGLHLHPWLTEDLLRKAGIVPKATRQDGAYRFLYTFHYKDSIDDCNIYLRSQGLPEFTQRDRSA